jgi:O-succinylbenzoic acid--CoA ligase
VSDDVGLAFSARRAAARSAPGPAVVDGRLRWSWAALDDRAEVIAAALVGAGIGAGDRVALLAVPSAGAIAMLHGIARAGAVAAPLGVGLTATELAAAAVVIDPRLVVYGPGLEPDAAASGRPILALDDLVAPVEPASAPAPVATVSDLAAPAVVILTSGTTGRPRAAVLSAAALVASAEAWLAAVPPATGWLLAVGLGHVAGLGVVWRAALSGVPLVVLSRPVPADILGALAADPAPSHVSLVPTTLGRVLDAADGPPPAGLRAVLLGGGPIPPDLVTRAIGAGWPIVPTYGLTEAGSGVTALPTVEAMTYQGSAGRALPGVGLRIAEPDQAGIGEILVHSPARFSGYLGDPVATAAAFTDVDWLRTGDLGRLDPDGRLTVLDRRTDRIVRGGENISPMDVEAVLLEHPAIADAAVVARQDPAFGQVPVAVIVLRADLPDPGDEALVLHCRKRLARFKVPTAFVRLDKLPRTAVGKLRRAELRASLDPVAEPWSAVRYLDRPGDVRLGYRTVGVGPVHVLLLHGTLSSARQLMGLARHLAASTSLSVHVVDRRGSGESRLADPAPIAIDVHVDDLVAVLDAEGCRAAALVGVSFGGVVALEFAARVGARALAVAAYEPPYGPVADALTQRAFATVAAATERAWETGGAPAAAETFMRGIADDAWDRLSDRTRAYLAAEGAGAYVDAGLRGLDPAGLGRIGVPVTILTGDASDTFYRPIAETLAGRIPGAQQVDLPGMTHASPINDPAPVAEAVVVALAAAGVSRPDAPEESHA